MITLLVSYNLDLECLLADDGACRQVCQEASEDICAEPSFGSSPAVAILPRPFVFQFFTGVECTLAQAVSQNPLPSAPGLSLPVGLRAPPSLTSL